MSEYVWIIGAVLNILWGVYNLHMTREMLESMRRHDRARMELIDALKMSEMPIEGKRQIIMKLSEQ